MNGLEAQSLGTSGKVGSSGKVVGVLRSGRLLLEFSTQVGRLAHALQYVGEQETVTLLESVVGTAASTAVSGTNCRRRGNRFFGGHGRSQSLVGQHSAARTGFFIRSGLSSTRTA